MNTHRPTTRAAAGGALGTVLIALVLAGCNHGTATSSSTTTGSGVTSSTTSPTTSSSTTESSTSSTAPPTSTSTSSATAGQRCLATALRPAIQSTGGAAGSTYLTIGLTNTGKASCTLRGYPGVSIVGHGNGTQIGADAVRDTTTPPVAVTLPVGHGTTFILRITQAANYPAATCSPVVGDGLRIYPPGSTEALFLADKGVTGCAKASVKLLTVRPVGVTAG